LIDLSRLPWFRYGAMPDWLRQRLILDLPTGVEGEVRTALEGLLLAAVQGQEGENVLEIARRQRESTSRLANPLLRLMKRQAPPESPLQDRVFLDFMLNRWNLAVRVPAAVRRQLLTRVGDQPGWKVVLPWVLLNLLVSGVWRIGISLYITLAGLSNIIPGGSMSSMTAFVIYAIFGILLGISQWYFLKRYWKINFYFWVLEVVLSTVFWQVIFVLVGVTQPSGPYPYELSMGILLGFSQTLFFARLRLPYARRWLYANLFSGLINTVLTELFQGGLDNAILFSSVPLVIITGLIYSLFSGAILLQFLQPHTGKTGHNLRQDWVLINSIANVFGLFVGATFGSSISQIIKDVPISVAVFFMIWLGIVIESQGKILQIWSFPFWKRWIFLSACMSAIALFVYSAGTYLIWQNFDLITGNNFLYNSFPGIGILIGLAQAFVWKRSHLQPLQMLTWFIFTVLGWSLSGFAFNIALTNFKNPFKCQCHWDYDGNPPQALS
jgi:hypothetical protein